MKIVFLSKVNQLSQVPGPSLLQIDTSLLGPKMWCYEEKISIRFARSFRCEIHPLKGGPHL